MYKAKNNHCVMRKQNWLASGARTGYIQEAGGRNWQCRQPLWTKHLKSHNQNSCQTLFKYRKWF